VRRTEYVLDSASVAVRFFRPLRPYRPPNTDQSHHTICLFSDRSLTSSSNHRRDWPRRFAGQFVAMTDGKSRARRDLGYFTIHIVKESAHKCYIFVRKLRVFTVLYNFYDMFLFLR